MNERGSEHKDVSDPSYNAADFRVQLTCGKLRWLASILTVASLGMFGYLLTKGKDAELVFPFQIKGEAAIWAVGIAFVIWFALATVNWVSWFKKKRNAR